jgi:hypothetical protein
MTASAPLTLDPFACLLLSPTLKYQWLTFVSPQLLWLPMQVLYYYSRLDVSTPMYCVLS